MRYATTNHVQTQPARLSPADLVDVRVKLNTALSSAQVSMRFKLGNGKGRYLTVVPDDLNELDALIHQLQQARHVAGKFLGDETGIDSDNQA